MRIKREKIEARQWKKRNHLKFKKICLNLRRQEKRRRSRRTVSSSKRTRRGVNRGSRKTVVVVVVGDLENIAVKKEVMIIVQKFQREVKHNDKEIKKEYSNCKKTIIFVDEDEEKIGGTTIEKDKEEKEIVFSPCY